MGLSHTVSYVWDESGTKVITITALNVYGSTMNRQIISVNVALDSVEIRGPEVGEAQES
jgi:hypothetical protein